MSHVVYGVDVFFQCLYGGDELVVDLLEGLVCLIAGPGDLNGGAGIVSSPSPCMLIVSRRFGRTDGLLGISHLNH